MVNGFTNMIAGSLNLKEPWYVEGAEFLPEEQEVHIYVGVREDAVFACPCCGGETVRNGYEANERVWRHGDCMFYPSFVHCRRPRIRCPRCGSTKVVNAPFERKNSRFTLLFEGYAMLILADMPRAKAADVLRCDEKSLATILNYWVNDAVKSRSLDDVERLAIDETSRLRGHDYVTIVIDADRRQKKAGTRRRSPSLPGSWKSVAVMRKQSPLSRAICRNPTFQPSQRTSQTP